MYTSDLWILVTFSATCLMTIFVAMEYSQEYAAAISPIGYMVEQPTGTLRQVLTAPGTLVENPVQWQGRTFQAIPSTTMQDHQAQEYSRPEEANAVVTTPEIVETLCEFCGLRGHNRVNCEMEASEYLVTRPMEEDSPGPNTDSSDDEFINITATHHRPVPRDPKPNAPFLKSVWLVDSKLIQHVKIPGTVIVRKRDLTYQNALHALCKLCGNYRTNGETRVVVNPGRIQLELRTSAAKLRSSTPARRTRMRREARDAVNHDIEELIKWCSRFGIATIVCPPPSYPDLMGEDAISIHPEVKDYAKAMAKYIRDALSSCTIPPLYQVDPDAYLKGSSSSASGVFPNQTSSHQYARMIMKVMTNGQFTRGPVAPERLITTRETGIRRRSRPSRMLPAGVKQTVAVHHSPPSLTSTSNNNPSDHYHEMTAAEDSANYPPGQDLQALADMAHSNPRIPPRSM